MKKAYPYIAIILLMFITIGILGEINYNLAYDEVHHGEGSDLASELIWESYNFHGDFMKPITQWHKFKAVLEYVPDMFEECSLMGGSAKIKK
jgi:hypothetical protein